MKICSVYVLLFMVISTLNAQISTDIYTIQQDETLLGKTVMVQAIVTVSTGIYGPEITLVADADGGPWSGLSIRDNTAHLFAKPGQTLSLVGKVGEREGITEILLENYTAFAGTYPLPLSEKISTVDLMTGSVIAESLESMIVHIDSVECVDAGLGDGQWLIDDGSGACLVGSEAEYLFLDIPVKGTMLSSIQGVVFESADKYKLEPRFQSDIHSFTDSTISSIYSLQQDISLMGEKIYVNGIVTASTSVFGKEKTFIADAHGGPWSGIMLWDSTAAFQAQRGDSIQARGWLNVIEGLMAIKIESADKVGETSAFVEPVLIQSADISSDSKKAEIYASVLCRIEDVFVSDSDLGNGEWSIDDGSAYCIVNSLSDSLIYNVPVYGSPLLSVTGIVNFSNTTYHLSPRDTYDIIEPESMAIGDTLTIIQRPIQNIPQIALAGDSISIECDADPTTASWSAALLKANETISLQIQSSIYHSDRELWIISAVIPSVNVFGLYDLQITVNNSITDISRHAVQVIQEFKEDYYFIHLTDPHLPTHKYYSEGVTIDDSSEMIYLRDVINDINIINPEFVLITGDLINEGELEELQHLRYFTRAQRLLIELKVPFYLTSGNHDIGGWSSTPPPDGTARRNWWKFFGWNRLNQALPADPQLTQNYSFDYGSVHYVGLESYLNYDSWRDEIYDESSFTSGQMQWLQDDLAAAEGSHSQLLFYHYDFKEELDLDALGVEMTLWGHTHSDGGNIYGGVPYNLGTRAVSDGKRAYRLIRVNKGNLQPSLTISAGANGTNFSVRYSPANDGTYNTVDAFIKNSLDESFEHALLRFVMPKSFDSISVTGGSLMQIDSSGENTLCYVAMNIQALSSQTVSLSMHYLIPSGILGSDKVIPSHFMLRQNYPNPFNAATVISYDIPNESQVILTVYDIKGRKLKTLVNKRQNPGYYSIRWNDPTLPSGLYFYSIKSLSFKQTKKMLYLK